MATNQAIELLEQLKTKLMNDSDSDTVLHPYEALADVLKAIVLLKGPNKRGHVQQERENDAPKTRQDAPKSPPAKATPGSAGSRNGSDTGQAAGREALSSGGDAPGLEESKWSTVERKKLKAKPKVPTVDLTRDTPSYSQMAARPAPAQTQQRPQARKAAEPQQQPPKRETPALKLVLSRESDWWPRLQLSGAQLRQEVQAKMGPEVAEAILGMRIHRGGIVMICPKPGQGDSLGQQDWSKWALSARPYTEEFEVVIRYLPVDGASAEEMVEKLYEQNHHITGLDFIRASWIGNTEGKERAALKASLPSPEMADYLLAEGLGLDFRRYPVEKFKKGTKRGQKCFETFARERLKRVQIPPTQHNTPHSSDSERVELWDTPMEEPETALFEEGSPLDLQNAKKQKVAAKGRPFGALNRSELHATPTRDVTGVNPFLLAKASRVPSSQPEADNNSQISETPSGEVADTEMTPSPTNEY